MKILFKSYLFIDCLNLLSHLPHFSLFSDICYKLIAAISSHDFAKLFIIRWWGRKNVRKLIHIRTPLHNDVNNRLHRVTARALTFLLLPQMPLLMTSPTERACSFIAVTQRILIRLAQEPYTKKTMDECCNHTNEMVSPIRRELLQIMDARFHTGRHFWDILVMYCDWKSFSSVV